MSNNKQSSIEWLYNKMYEHRGNITIEEFEQAKTMHKDEIANAYISGVISEMNNPLDAMNYKIDGEEYYNETFGSQTTLEQEGEQ